MDVTFRIVGLFAAALGSKGNKYKSTKSIDFAVFLTTNWQRKIAGIVIDVPVNAYRKLCRT
jgi:hypothetical protein